MAKPDKCKECTHENVPEDGFPCHLCGYLVGAEKSQIGVFKKKQTHGDRIRNMTDEQLADFLVNFKNTFGEEYEGKMSCLEWLKSEAE